MFATILRMAHPPAPALIVEDADRGALQAAVRARTSEQRAVTRARIVLRSAEGAPIERIAAELGVAIMTVKLWRRRYAAAGPAGLVDAPRPGHPPTYTRADRDRLVALTMGPPPEGMSHWSVRVMARRTGMSPSTVHRIWAELGYKPHRTETFKFSTDPALEAKIRDVVGLYLDPPDGAIVLSVDEKTQIGALDRTQPQLPMRPGQVERHTHDYTRHGTTCLFAALEVGTGQVTTDTRDRHTGTDFLSFMRRVAREYPTGEPHVVLDNVSTHKTPAVRAWLERHPRITFHFTPTSASWMNQVETWFGILTRQAIRRGSFRSVRELVAMIDAFTRAWNDGSSPFTWVKTADEILAKAVRKPRATNEPGHELSRTTWDRELGRYGRVDPLHGGPALIAGWRRWDGSDDLAAECAGTAGTCALWLFSLRAQRARPRGQIEILPGHVRPLSMSSEWSKTGCRR
jgi:transposase